VVVKRLATIAIVLALALLPGSGFGAAAPDDSYLGQID
jgi:hypothetical protein